jgi:hypothetical protein
MSTQAVRPVEKGLELLDRALLDSPVGDQTNVHTAHTSHAVSGPTLSHTVVSGTLEWITSECIMSGAVGDASG